MEVRLFSTKTCPYCVMVKRWLDEKNVEYKEYRVDQNPVAAQYMVQISGQRSVPLTVVEKGDDTDAKLVLGFDPKQLESALGI